MPKSLGRRIVTEHGLASNVLPGLVLSDQLLIANLNSRTYAVIVPWYSTCILIPAQVISDFPEIDLISDDFVCKSTNATIDNEQGIFYGSVHKQTGLPSGDGVFVAQNGWIHCGAVREGTFAESR